MKNVLITNATIIDGTGKKPLENRDILVEKNIIKDIIPSNSLKNPEFEIIDAQGSFILPGFIDTHTHLMANGFRMEDNMQKPLALHFYNALKNMEKTLNAGVTTVRDAGLADAGVKMAAEKNLFPAPRMQICVMPLSISGGHFDFFLKSGFDMKLSYPGLPESICDGEAEVRKRTREVLRSGAEVIKVMATGGVISANDSPEFSQFTLKELQAVVEEADYKGGLKVMAHAHGIEGIKNSLKAGIHSIEHGTYLDQEAADMMVENNAYLVPTFVVTNLNKKKALQGELPEYSRKEAIEISHVHQENMELAYHSGVQIVMGTDCGVVEHGNNLLELEYLCKMGMEPQEALMAGTLKAAQCIGWEEKIGSIEKGKLADMVLVKKNPLDDISSLSDDENILMVIKDGTVFKDNLNGSD